MLQWMHAIFISRHIVVVGEGYSKLGVIFSVFPLSLSNMFFTILGGGGGWQVGWGSNT